MDARLMGKTPVFSQLLVTGKMGKDKLEDEEDLVGGSPNPKGYV